MLGFVFGFDDGKASFSLIPYLANMLKFAILSLMVLFVYYRIQKYFAKRAGALTKIHLWKAGNFKFPFQKKKTQLSLWLIVPIIVSLLSLGQIFFAAVLSTEIIVKPAYRVGRKFRRLSEFEYAKINVSAPIVLILIALVLNPFPIFKDIVLITSMVSIFSMLPLPKLPGIEIFFGSRALYVFSIAFILIIAAILKLQSLPSFSILILALFIAIVIFIVFLWNFYKRR